MPVLPAASPDAIRCPLGLPVVPPGSRLEDVIKSEFGKILGVAQVHSSRVESLGMRFMRANPYESHFHDAASGMEGLERHYWVDRGDGVEYGYKTKATRDLDASRAKPPELPAAARIDQADRMLADGIIDSATHQKLLVEIGPDPEAKPEPARVMGTRSQPMNPKPEAAKANV